MGTSNLFGQNFDTQRVLNGDFYTWPGALPNNWLSSGGTVVKDTADKFIGVQSLQLTGVPNGIVYQTLSNISVLYNTTIRFSCWVKASVASSARIAIYDSDGNSYSSYHTGSGVWEELVIERALAEPTYVRVVLLVESSVTANFDNVKVSLWNFDGGLNFDGTAIGDFDMEMEWSLYPSKGYYIAREFREFIIEMLFDEVITYIKFIDLLPLIPEKFHAIEPDKPPSTGYLLEDFIYQIGRYVGAWMSKADELPRLQDPYAVGIDYIHFLADLINLTLVVDENSTLDSLRRQLSQAIDWYKLKGTYKALSIVTYLSGFTINIYDMYTNDYVTFIKVAEWFVADSPGENPTGLDSSYYKSPHFGVEVVLDTTYQPGSNPYLWKNDQLQSMSDSIESMRPANTVPHYIAFLNPQTIEDEDCHTTTGSNIITRVTQYWQQRLYFDMTTSSLEWFFDGGKNFDYPLTAFLDSVSQWKLGTGNKSVSPCSSGFGLDNVVLTGTVDSYTVYDDRVEIEFTIPESVAVTGLSELALIRTDTNEDVLYSTFPSVDKTEGMELRIVVTVYFI
jgi:hypothetical protein